MTLLSPRPRRFVTPIPVFAILLFGAGCKEPNTPVSTFTVRDSAGIEIVESSAPLLGPDAWTISDEPVLQIGELEGEDPYLFAGIFGSGSSLGKVFRLRDDRIVVCNDMDRTIRFFDEEGSFIKKTGGEGEGPGEFQRMISCFPVQEGFAVRSYPDKVTVFDGKGDLIRSARISPIDNARAVPQGVLSNGFYLVTEIGRRTEDIGSGILRELANVSLVTPDGRSNHFLFEMTTALVPTETGTSVIRFGPSGLVRAKGEEILYGWSERYEIQTFDAQGRLVGILRRAWEPVPVTEEDRQQKRDFYVTRGNTSPPSPAMVRVAEAMVFSGHHAVFDQLIVDQTGHLWVRHQHPQWDPAYERSNLRFPFGWTWDVFDPSGRWLTTLTLPSTLEIHDMGEDYILGVWKDEMDVEYVRMYSLDRGEN